VFDRYVVVDWSASSTPKLGRDSIWIAVCDQTGTVSSSNVATRDAADAALDEIFSSDPTSTTLVGVDFSLGYPVGTAAALGLAGTPWSAMWKMLADRIAEAFAERMHERVRTELWGYAADESFTPSELLKESFQGIRPAPGYPSQPDHTEKLALFELLDAPNAVGVELTESFAMWPGSSVSGLYFAHPEAKYFGVGKIKRDQLADYATRKGWTIEEAEQHLAPVLDGS